MTLDESIKNEEEIAIQQIEKANALDNIPLFGMSEDDIEEIKECYKCSKEHEQLAEWLKELKQLREQTRWIPADKELPKDENYVLCWYEYWRYGDYNGLYQTYGIGFCWNGSWGGEVSCGERCKVIAWMPLPEPYKASPTGAEKEG